MKSASGPLTRSSTDVRSSRSRTSGGWRSSTSASRYPATVRSLPENSLTKHSGSGCSASEIAASRSPAAQPSVRSCSSATPASERATPASLSSSRVSSRENRRAVARSSVERPATRRRCSPSPGSARVTSTDPQLWRQPGEKQLERGPRAGRLQLVQIVDHEHDRLVERAEIRQQLLDDHLAAQARSGADPGHPLVRTDGAGKRVDHGQPEPLAVTLAAVDRHPRRPIGQAGRFQPGAHEDRLAASGRSGDQRHFTGGRGPQLLEERSSLDDPAPGRRAV